MEKVIHFDVLLNEDSLNQNKKSTIIEMDMKGLK